jgi:hypothetical protein
MGSVWNMIVTITLYVVRRLSYLSACIIRRLADTDGPAGRKTGRRVFPEQSLLTLYYAFRAEETRASPIALIVLML